MFKQYIWLKYNQMHIKATAVIANEICIIQLVQTVHWQFHEFINYLTKLLVKFHMHALN